MTDSTAAAHRSTSCSCCGSRAARIMVRMGLEHPTRVAVCPVCDTHPDALPGWTESPDDPRR